MNKDEDSSLFKDKIVSEEQEKTAECESVNLSKEEKTTDDETKISLKKEDTALENSNLVEEKTSTNNEEVK